ncbi:hypothetical protein FHY55_04725 [Oceanicola sp. D3]|uniref:dynamin family protein n=1 Tax=Oceanicola sp. D3 TaxID=2587163 RepID=UPI00111E6DDF|nr:dynamin family protein [Oceanicola sp. D3]QDC08585.1 hypothetical protein FHY55_04725 [Oceanicola sp. D3]
MNRVFKRFKSGNRAAAAAAEKAKGETAPDEDTSIEDILDVETEAERELREAREAIEREMAEEAARKEAEAAERAQASKTAHEEKILNAVREAAKPDPKGLRKPRLMVAGEFSAGKTHLINGLLGEKVLPSNVTATALPPIWLVWGRKAMMAVDLEGNTRPLDSLEDVGVEDTHYVVLSHPAPLLKTFSIIDTPGNSDPNIPSECWERMLDYADAVVWCTNATQAWRQSEKSVWNEMPARLLEKATILITHADRITDARSADRVLRRVKREAGKYFDSYLMASLLKEGDLARIREHLETLMEDLESRDGAVCSTVAHFASDHAMTEAEEEAAAKEAAERKEAALKAALRAADGKTTAKDDTPDASQDADAKDEAEAPKDGAAPAEAEEAKTAEEAGPSVTPKRVGRSKSSKTQKATRAARARKKADVVSEADAAAKAEEKTEAKADDVAETKAEAGPSAEVHLFVPPASEDAEKGAEAGPARRLWEGLSKDIDRTDAEAVLACVEELLDALDGEGKAPETPFLDAREDSKAATGPSHSAMSRRKS